jgi:hypothetical protein
MVFSIGPGGNYTLRFFLMRQLFDYTHFTMHKLFPNHSKVKSIRSNVWDLTCTLYLVHKLYTIKYIFGGFINVADCGVDQKDRVDLFDDYLLTELGWFVSTFAYDLMNRSCDVEMGLHHGISIALILLAIHANVTCIGISIIPFMLLSNPLQHAVKILHKIHPRGFFTNVCFMAFAVMFFTNRVVMFPLYYIIPFVQLEANGKFDVFYPLLYSLYGLQLYWFVKIVKILKANIALLKI